MELVMHMPAIVTIVIAFPLDQILEVIISHLTVKDCFDLVFIFTININEHQWWRGRLMSWDGVWESNGECKGNLTNLRRELHLSLVKGDPK
jgi:hypothetical protein